MVRHLFLLLLLLIHAPLSAQQPDRTLLIETIVNAPAEKVWEAFTTRKGLESFFAPRCNIDLRVDGKLDILFNPDAPEGSRGAEGMRILAVQPYRMFSFSWNNPPDFPEIRNQRTVVTVKFFPGGKGKTKLVLIQSGWGDGEFWDLAYSYFTRAWRDVVLFRLHYRFDKGPVNWDNPPVNLDQYNIIVQ